METLQRTANRGSLSTGYNIENSIGLEEANDENLRTTNQAAGNQKTWTFSVWVKRTQLTYSWATIFGAGRNYIAFDADDRLQYRNYDGTSNYYLESTALFRDTSAWYHIVAIQDTTQATASDRVRLYVNGEQITDFSTEDYPPQNLDGNLGGIGSSLNWIQFGRFYSGGRHYSGYLAEAHYLNGTVAEATEFGEYDADSGIWIPKKYTGGGYGTQGFYYKFDNAASLGEDSSGEGHDANTYDNVTSANQATDTPTNNFCTLNPLWTFGNTMGVSDGGTKVNNTVIAWGGAKGSIGVNSGKWYWEHGSFSGNDTMFGIQNQAGGGNTQAYLDPYTLAIQANSNVIQFTDPSNRTEAFTKTFSITDIWGVALDLDANTIAFYRNGSIVNSAFSIDGLIGNGEFFPFVTHYGSGLNSRVNFGGYTGITISSAASDENGYGTFEYAPPSGYYALCTKNLAEYG